MDAQHREVKLYWLWAFAAIAVVVPGRRFRGVRPAGGSRAWHRAARHRAARHFGRTERAYRPAGSGAGCCAALPHYEHCLFKLGVHLGEFWYLSELAAWLAEHGRSRFLLTAPPLRLPGAVGSPITPVATV